MKQLLAVLFLFAAMANAQAPIIHQPADPVSPNCIDSRIIFSDATNNAFIGKNGACNQFSSGGGAGMAIGGAVTGGTAGSVLFVGAGPVLAQDNANLFWDDTAKTLKLNNSVPGSSFLSAGIVAAQPGLVNIGDSTSAHTDFLVAYTGLNIGVGEKDANTISFSAQRIYPNILHTSGTLSDAEGLDVKWTINGAGGTTNQAYGILVRSPTKSAGTLVSDIGIRIDGQTQGSTNNYALSIGDQAGAINNWAIKTGLGLVDFGGTVKNHVNPFTSTANVAAVDLDLGNFQTHVLTEDTTCSISHIRAGEKITFMIQQNAAAAKTFTCGAAQNVIGFMTVDPTLSSVNVQVCDVSPNGTDLYCELGQTGLTGGTF